MVGLVAAAMATAEFDRARLAERAGQGWITVTELADTLAREQGVPFKTSHEIATRLVAESSRRPGEPLEQVLADVSVRVIWAGRSTTPTAKLDGDPQPAALRRGPHDARRTGAVRDRARLRGVADAGRSRRGWLQTTVQRLADAEARLTETANAL